MNTVLLAITEDSFNTGLLKYALNVSRRTGFALDILYLVKPNTKNKDLKAFMARYERNGVRSIVVRREGFLKDAVLNYTAWRSGVQFVIIGSEQGFGAGKKKRPSIWGRLKCPLVVVSRSEAASAS